MQYKDYNETCCQLLNRIEEAEIASVLDTITDCYSQGCTLFIIGNGGSAANASHLCEDLGKGTLSDFSTQKRLRVISLTDNTPYIMALGNDLGYESIFVEQLKNLANPRDYMIVISCSGTSANVVKAVEYARMIEMVTVGFTGAGGGELAKMVDRNIAVPSANPGIVEAVHGVIFHYLTEVLYTRFKGY